MGDITGRVFSRIITDEKAHLMQWDHDRKQRVGGVPSIDVDVWETYKGSFDMVIMSTNLGKTFHISKESFDNNKLLRSDRGWGAQYYAKIYLWTITDPNKKVEIVHAEKKVEEKQPSLF